MDEHKVSDAEFAERIGITRQAVHRYRANKRRPTNSELLAKITAATDGAVTANDFYGSEEAATQTNKEPECAK